MGNDFEIEADAVDVEALMETIRERVEQKRKTGVYDKYNLDGLKTLEFESLEDENEFLRYYLRLIQGTCDINIGDFEIVNKGGVLGKPVVILKKVIWKLLKFYTYRMFSQQKEFNCQMVNTVLCMNKKLKIDLEELSARIEELENQNKLKDNGSSQSEKSERLADL